MRGWTLVVEGIVVLRPDQPRPACMDEREYDEWTVANDRCADGARAPSPCSDCTRTFREAMRREGRCVHVVRRHRSSIADNVTRRKSRSQDPEGQQ